jgi:hypothetical protein
MKLTKAEFKKLQKQWYEKLKETGFKDIESQGQTSTHGSPKLNEVLKKTLEDYWTLIRHKVCDDLTTYRNEIDKYVLNRYAEGAKLTIIARELKNKKTPRHRQTIRDIIRRYEMIWQIRSYTPSQLGFRQSNKKKKNPHQLT